MKTKHEYQYLNHTLNILTNNGINLLPRDPLNSRLNPLLPINKKVDAVVGEDVEGMVQRFFP
jgi:hypothetical protein